MSWVRDHQDELNRPAAPLPNVVLASSDGELSTHGFSDVAGKKPAARSTAYGIGSTSKVFAALTAMRLASDGLLDLHQPVSSILGDRPLLAGRAASRATPDGGQAPNERPASRLTRSLAGPRAAGIQEVGTYWSSDLGRRIATLSQSNGSWIFAW